MTGCCDRWPLRWRWLRVARPDLGPWIDMMLGAQDLLRWIQDEDEDDARLAPP